MIAVKTHVVGEIIFLTKPLTLMGGLGALIVPAIFTVERSEDKCLKESEYGFQTWIDVIPKGKEIHLRTILSG